MLKIPLIGTVVRLIASAVGASVCECVLLLLAGSYAFYKWTSVLVVVPLAARLAIGNRNPNLTAGAGEKADRCTCGKAWRQ